MAQRPWWSHRIARPALLAGATGLALFGAGASLPAEAVCATTSPEHHVSAPLLGDDVAIGCPLREKPPKLIRLSVQVKKFCIVPTPFHQQVEFKLKIRVKNVGSNTIDIRAPHWRLLFSRFVSRRWHPPANGGAVGRPTRVLYHGYRVWSIPANANGSYDVDPDTGYASFASFWDGTDLAPGSTYFRPANRQGDLAFYAPGRYVAMHHNLIGVAYVAGGRARVVARYRNWRGRTGADGF